MNILIEDRRFYVYFYLDPRKNGNYKYGNYEFNYEPFYVGKGFKNRLYKHLTEAKKYLEKGKKIKSYKINKIKKIIKSGLTPIVFKFESNLTENEAHFLEEKLVDIIGRIRFHTGPLVNIKGGGKSGMSGKNNPMYGRNDQCHGLIKYGKGNKNKTYEEIHGEEKAKTIKKQLSKKSSGRIQTEEDRKKKSISNKKVRKNNERLRKIASENGKKNKGKKRTEEHKKKISENMPDMSGERNGMFNKKHKPESIEKIRMATQNRVKVKAKDIIQLYEEGYTMNEIAKKFNICRRSVSRRIKNPEKYY